ncbi:aminoglycoside phosphotransferase family protein [Streptomyces sp. NPDC005799]|uniref:phosphotransferase family protein n=1 Tax=Streptomyces sp. NPDC005799 TaxID=3154678 RepID=UPI0033EBC61B
MGLTAELRAFLPIHTAGLLTRPVDLVIAHRLADSLRADGAIYGRPRGPRRTLSDLLVFRLDGAAAPSILVKHPRSSRAVVSLAEECNAMRQLAHDESLGAWRRLLPMVEECRLEGPLPLVVEKWLPGIEGDTLLQRSPQLARPVTVSALEAIRELHRATGRREVVTARVGHWVDPRLAVLAEEVRWCRRGEGAEALALLRDRVVRALAGRSLLVAWTHGDFHPGNVLLTRRHGELCGVIDWAGALPEGPSVLDCHTFVLTMRHLLERRQLGQVVADVVRRASLLPEDRRLLAEAGELASDAECETAFTLLTWLWHVAGNVAKSARYGRSHRWVADNVVSVLSEVLAQGTP